MKHISTAKELTVASKGIVNIFLDRIDKIINWGNIEKALTEKYKKKTNADGRPAYPAVSMFKLLLLQQWYGLSDPAAEKALKDRISFIRFGGFSLESSLPDHSTISRFRNSLLEMNLYETLLAEVNGQMEEKNLFIKKAKGAIVDAAIIESSNKPGKIIDIIKKERRQEKMDTSAGSDDTAEFAEITDKISPKRKKCADIIIDKAVRNKTPKLRKLDKYDDLYIHQGRRSIVEVDDDDPQWFDRCYIAVHDPDAKFMMNLGMGVYPNVGLMDGWTSVVTGTTQRNIRVFRKLHGDRADMKIGPLQFDVIELLEHWRLQLKENEYGITFDMEFKKRGNIYYYQPIISPGETGGPDLNWEHYGQIINVNGTLTVEGKKYEVKDCGFFRDRSWGSRRLWQWGAYWLYYVPFSDYCIYLLYAEHIDNSLLLCDGAVLYDNGKVTPILEARNKCEFTEGTFRHLHSAFEIVCANGKKKKFTMTKFAQAPLIYGAGYMWRQGVDCGEYHIESDEFDVNDPAFLEMPTDFYDQLCVYDDGKEKVKGWFEFGKCNINWQYKPSL